jgi:hypothetical protein
VAADAFLDFDTRSAPPAFFVGFTPDYSPGNPSGQTVAKATGPAPSAGSDNTSKVTPEGTDDSRRCSVSFLDGDRLRVKGSNGAALISSSTPG